MNDQRNPLDGLRPVIAPAELRAPTLAAAREVLARGRQRLDRWTRLVESRVARLAWATAVIALVLGHLVLSAPDGSISPPIELTPYFANGTDPELIELSTQAPIDAGARSSLGSSSLWEENGS